MSTDAIARVKQQKQKDPQSDPTPGTAEWEAQQHKVLGFNHVRRSPQDIEVDRAVRARQGPRWRRRLRYRCVNSRRMRQACIWVVCLTAALLAMCLLWTLGEMIAGLAVAGSFLLIALVACTGTEILVGCPKLTEGLLFHAGFLERVYNDYEDLEGYGYVVHDATGESGQAYGEVGLHTVPDDGEYYHDDDDGDEEGKPVWGDHAAQVHSKTSQLKRLGERTLNAVASMSDTYAYAAEEEALAMELEQIEAGQTRYMRGAGFVDPATVVGYDGDQDIEAEEAEEEEPRDHATDAPPEPAKAEDKMD